MNPAKNRERKCSTCKHYQPSPLWRKGWCRNPLLYDRNTNHLVEADSLACNRTFIDYWEPAGWPARRPLGPQARSSKPRIAPSIPVDTMDAQGRRTTVTGQQHTDGRNGGCGFRPEKASRRIARTPALSLVTPDFDEVFGEDEASTTAPLEEVSGRRAGERHTGPQAVRKPGQHHEKALPPCGQTPAPE